MTARPLVKVFSAAGVAGKEPTTLPDIFSSPIRADLVRDVFTNVNKNKRQPYAVSRHAGEQTSAESWGTGRAVARIPRVAGGGTHRAGQGAFGNMCRGGRMFAPTKIWRKWHRKVNVAQKRFAIASALAGSAVPALVLARGHRIEETPEVPLVVSSLDSVAKTREAVKVLESLGAYADIEKVKNSHKIRTGRGKSRNRRHVQRRGPLIIYGKKGTLIQAFRNIPGVDTCSVERLNLLQLAPGGHLGRFIIWTEDAFARLDTLYGTFTTPSKEKKGFLLPRAKLTNADLGRIINSDEVQSHLRVKRRPSRRATHKKNPLNNRGAMIKLNPFEATRIRRQIRGEEKRKEAKSKTLASRRSVARKSEKIAKSRRPQRKALLANHLLYEGVPKKTPEAAKKV